MSQTETTDYGATGAAALVRPRRTIVVLGDDRSIFRDVGVEVVRYTVTQLDALRGSRNLTYEQYCAGRAAIAVYRAAGLAPQMTSRYEEWISGARGSPIVTDDDEDQAAPWRELLASLPVRDRLALESLAMNTLTPQRVSAAKSALDEIARRHGLQRR